MNDEQYLHLLNKPHLSRFEQQKLNKETARRERAKKRDEKISKIRKEVGRKVNSWLAIFLLPMLMACELMGIYTAYKDSTPHAIIAICLPPYSILLGLYGWILLIL